MSVMKNLTGGLAAVAAAILAWSVPAAAQEKRTVYTDNDFHWSANMKPGQTLEVIGRNGGIDASGASGESAQVQANKETRGDSRVFVEVVEYPDGVAICAVYAQDAKPGRCHRGGVDSEESHGWSWHGEHSKLTFNVQVPRGVLFKAMTTNGGVHCNGLNSVVQAATTNGNVEVSTSEWASAHTTNGSVTVSMGSAKWSGEVDLTSTNGSVHASLPAAAEFEVQASTTNGGIHTDFQVTVQGNLGAKNISGTVGGGGRELRVATTNGGIELRKSGS